MELWKHFSIVSIRQNSRLEPCVVDGAELRLLLIQRKFYNSPRRKPELSGIDPSSTRKKPIFHRGVGMIHWDASCSHGIDEFFSKVIGFGAVFQTYDKLIGRQKPDVLIVVDIGAGKRLPRVVIGGPPNPQLRENGGSSPMRQADRTAQRAGLISSDSGTGSET